MTAATTMTTLPGWLAVAPMALSALAALAGLGRSKAAAVSGGGAPGARDAACTHAAAGAHALAASAPPSADARPGRALLPRPARMECIGNLEIVTRAPRALVQDIAAAEPTARYGLRWKGRAVRLGAGEVDAVFVLGMGSAPGLPDVLVHARDGGDAGAFHLLVQRDGQLHVRRLCATAGGPGAVRVLGPTAVPATQAPRHRPLAGARWLLLGTQVVYDVVLRRARIVPAAGTADALCVWNSVAPLGLSPDGCSLARFGSVVRGDQRLPHVLVADLEAGTWSALPIDRSRMRYATHEMLDPAWLAHHFAWQRDGHGRDRLVERRHFRPLAWRGTRSLDGAGYRLEGAPASTGAACAAMLLRRFGAQVQPRHATTLGVVMHVEGQPVQVLPDGFRVLPVVRSAAERERQAALARRLADAMDEELAAGERAAQASASRGAACREAACCEAA